MRHAFRPLVVFMTKTDIVRGLRELGLLSGDRVLVHSSLAALGDVEGGADTVIDALLEAVGPDGLVMVPTFMANSPFDRKTSATGLGKIADTFWRRPNAIRSLHPTHSVAAIGAGAEDLIRDHEKAPTAYAEDTPYIRLAEMGGKLLLLGVDQDRNTTLHAAEAMSGAAYLDDIEDTYIDDNGKEVTIKIKGMAGPHRNFIALDRLFRERGVMTMGKVGKAVCRLMDMEHMMETALEALDLDPSAVLCENPECADCIMQRGKIKAARLAREDFTLAAVASDISDDAAQVLTAIQGEGISTLEITADEYPAYADLIGEAGVKIVAVRGKISDEKGAELAAKLGVPFIVPAGSVDEIGEASKMSDKGAKVLVENTNAGSSVFREAYAELSNSPGLAFNPANFAAAGEHPFLSVFYRGLLRHQTKHFYMDDGTFGGKPTFPGRGNGEVAEILSMLRCRGYDGVITLRSHGGGAEAFKEAAGWFWRVLDNI